MPDMKDEDSGFLGRLYRFVNSPRTEWGDFDPGQDEGSSPSSRSELQIMIERKRRNDFVRKQEFELLRRIRREGITAAQLRAHGEEGEYAKTVVHAREDSGRLGATVRTKIEGLEKTMMLAPRTTATVREAPAIGPQTSGMSMPFTAPVPVEPMRGRPRPERQGTDAIAPRVDLSVAAAASPPAARPAGAPAASSRWHPLIGSDAADTAQRSDPVLEEAAFAFATADFVVCESTLRQLIAPEGARERHTETWLTLLDLYRATAQQQRFEATAADYRREFGLEPGPWESVPRLAAGAAKAVVGRALAAPEKGLVHWVCPAFLDGQAMSTLTDWCRIKSRRRHMDWSALQMIDAQAAQSLEALMTDWASASLASYWSGIDRLLDLLEVAAPPGDPTADPTFWRLRLVILRLLDRQEDHHGAAREVATLYGGEAPGWKPPRQAVRQGEPPKEAGRSEFMISTLPDTLGRVRASRIDLAGQLTGDIAGALAQCDTELQDAEVITIDCSRLIRVDFVAAGELVNWVAAQSARQRAVQFQEVHRLVALFFCAMGLDDHARVEVRGMRPPEGASA